MPYTVNLQCQDCGRRYSMRSDEVRVCPYRVDLTAPPPLTIEERIAAGEVSYETHPYCPFHGDDCVADPREGQDFDFRGSDGLTRIQRGPTS